MKKIILVGTGPMAEAYMDVLKTFHIEIEVIGRGEISADKFFANKGIKPFVGGLELYLKSNGITNNTHAIIATGTENLLSSMKMLLQAGLSKILVEKPAAISIEELLENEEYLEKHSKQIYVAYNRRFYASVLETIKLIKEDGGLESMHFEFTEWAHRIEDLQKAPGVKENWFFANSTHVVDAAFFIAGKPRELSCYSKSGAVKWHDKINFSGAGITENETLFSYNSNWESAGRWSIELMTNKRRIYLKPLEEVKIQVKGSLEISNHEFDDSLDKQFKPGLYLQIKYFVEENFSELLDIKTHISNSKNIYQKILVCKP